MREVIIDLVLSISDDSGLRDGVDSGTGSLQEGQLHGASRRNSGSLLMPETSLVAPSLANRAPKREPPSRDPFPADAAWVENLESWVLFNVSCNPKA